MSVWYSNTCHPTTRIIELYSLASKIRATENEFFLFPLNSNSNGLEKVTNRLGLCPAHEYVVRRHRACLFLVPVPS